MPLLTCNVFWGIIRCPKFAGLLEMIYFFKAADFPRSVKLTSEINFISFILTGTATILSLFHENEKKEEKKKKFNRPHG